MSKEKPMLQIATQNKNLVMPEGTVITLKEITDLIGTRHDKAMAKILALSKEPSFGLVSQMDISVSRGNNAKPQVIKTLALTKKQAIASAARLDNTMLMQVIDRIEELENKEKSLALPNFEDPAEAAMAWAKEYREKEQALLEVKEKEAEIEHRNEIIEKKDNIIRDVADLNVKAGEVLIGDFAKNLNIEGMGQNNLYKWLKGRGFLSLDRKPYQQYVNRGYFVMRPSSEKINGKYRYTTYITAKGTVWITRMIKAEYDL